MFCIAGVQAGSWTDKHVHVTHQLFLILLTGHDGATQLQLHTSPKTEGFHFRIFYTAWIQISERRRRNETDQ